ncbi:NYN domain-containing protein [Diaporthe sp. PMI_573]|nr:NYN domain-containing protein [Diaporthaceae sp. PMI_573]
MGSDRLALLVDGDNVSSKVITGILAEIAKHGTASVRRIYGDWTQPNFGPWKKCLLENSMQPVQQFAYTTGKNATDGAMIIDAMDLLYTGRFDGFCLVSSDSDFTRLAVRIREQGLTVHGFGERKTPRPFISACDKFYYFHALETVRSAEAPPAIDSDGAPGAAAWRPVVPTVQSDEAGASTSPTTAPAFSSPDTSRLDEKALSSLKNAVIACGEDDGRANLANVGSYLTKQSPDFNAANYGFRKLRELAEASGILEVELEKRPNGSQICMVQLKDTLKREKRRRTSN